MAATTKVWANSLAPTCEDVDLNGFKLENNNLIQGSGQTLNTADRQQTNKAVAVYSGSGDFYLDSGSPAAHVLAPTGAKVAPVSYSTGMRVRYVPAADNLLGAVSVNVAGLGVKSITQNGSSTIRAGVFQAGMVTQLYYTGTTFEVEESAFKRSPIVYTDHTTLTAVNTTANLLLFTTTLPGTTLRDKATLVVTAAGELRNNSAMTRDLVFRLKLGTTNIIPITSTIPIPAGIANRAWIFEARIVALTTTTQLTHYTLTVGDEVFSSTPGFWGVSTVNLGSNPSVEDTDVDLLLSLEMAMDSVDPDFSIEKNTATVHTIG